MSYTRPLIAFQILSIPQILTVSNSVRLSLGQQLSKNKKNNETKIITGVGFFKLVSSLMSMLLCRGITLVILLLVEE